LGITNNQEFQFLSTTLGFVHTTSNLNKFKQEIEYKPVCR